MRINEKQKRKWLIVFEEGQQTIYLFLIMENITPPPHTHTQEYTCTCFIRQEVILFKEKYLKSNACVYESWIRFFFLSDQPNTYFRFTYHCLIRFGLNLVLCIASQSMEWSGPRDFDSWSLTNNRIFLWRLIKTLDYM